MSSKSDHGFTRIKDRIPYHGKGTDDLIGAVRKILSDPSNKFTQKIVLEVGIPHIYMEKLVPDAEVPDLPKLSLHDIIRTRRMEEYSAEETRPLEHLWEIFDLIEREGLQVNVIAIGNKNRFQKWLKIRMPYRNMNILGTPIQIVGELPEDVFIVCGAPLRSSDVEDIEFSIKATI